MFTEFENWHNEEEAGRLRLDGQRLPPFLAAAIERRELAWSEFMNLTDKFPHDFDKMDTALVRARAALTDCRAATVRWRLQMVCPHINTMTVLVFNTEGFGKMQMERRYRECENCGKEL